VTGPHARRGFLRGLATLPLIGGGVTLIGDPVRAAEPATPEMLASYQVWLVMEERYLAAETGRRGFNPNTPGGMYHWRSHGEPPGPHPSSRAAVVLAAVGCDWRS